MGGETSDNDIAEFRLDLPNDTRLLFGEVKANIARLGGKRVTGPEALRAVLQVYQMLPESERQRMVRALIRTPSPGRFT